MCYFLYGAIDKSVDSDEYALASKGSPYKFARGTKHDLKMCIIENTPTYFVTNWACDCDFPVGMKDESREELVSLAALINRLKCVKGAGSIYISKTWIGQRNKSEKTVHINDIEIIPFLANMDLDCLYLIKLN